MENTESAWVFDSLVGFLHGPIWNDPLQTFIEEKSLLFEPTENGDVIERPEYKKIHEEYKNLVDLMLGSFMDDIGITAEQFESACRMSAGDLAGLPAHFHRRLFDQIWAANDYDIFAKMMTHKNVELQLQALELIERRFGALPSIFSSDFEDLETTRSDDSGDWSDKDNILTELKKMKMEDCDDDLAVAVPPEEVVAEKQTLLSKLQIYEKREVEKAEAMKFQEEQQSNHEGINQVDVPTTSPPQPLPKKIEVSEEDVQARQTYLKQQRDKLLAVKKRVRERRLGAAQAEEEAALGGGEAAAASKRARPRSARAAAAALAGAAPAPAPDAMQLRRALANKLKTEVVDKY